MPSVKSHRRLWEKTNSEGAKGLEDRPGMGRSWEASSKEGPPKNFSAPQGQRHLSISCATTQETGPGWGSRDTPSLC